MEYEEKFVAFVDILGFSNLVMASEQGTGPSLREILATVGEMAGENDKLSIYEYGPTLCPQSAHSSREIGFQVTQISDCMIVSSEVSPVGGINLLAHCWRAAFRLLKRRYLCRGYVTRGFVHHTQHQVIGPAYQRAVNHEKSRTSFSRAKKDGSHARTPFIEVDDAVSKYILANGDNCVCDAFHKIVQERGGVYAVFPFSVISTMVGGSVNATNLDLMQQKEQIAEVRNWIRSIKSVLEAETEVSVRKKTDCYIEMLEENLSECDRMDEMIEALGAPLLPLRYIDINRSE